MAIVTETSHAKKERSGREERLAASVVNRFLLEK
jgi:hypothetical protein